ncbi:hypothetical protein B0H14DRAFT_3467543 [Mycena olivaceomarginata]|nr:hypothetical protein B0H14DRAFT_3467543 [Mycena olivaceomarginata]
MHSNGAPISYGFRRLHLTSPFYAARDTCAPAIHTIIARLLSHRAHQLIDPIRPTRTLSGPCQNALVHLIDTAPHGRWLTYGDTADAQNARGSGYHDIAIRAVLPTLVSMLDIWPLRVNAADLDFDLERRGYRHHTGGSARTAVLRSPRYTLFPSPLIRSLNAIMSLQI